MRPPPGDRTAFQRSVEARGWLPGESALVGRSGRSAWRGRRLRRDYARTQGDVLAAQVLGIACPVVVLLVMEDQRHHVQELSLLDDPLAQQRMLLDLVPLVGREAALLGQDSVGDADLAHIVQPSTLADKLDLRSGEPDPSGDGRRELRHPVRVLVRVAVTDVDGSGQTADDGSPSGVGVGGPRFPDCRWALHGTVGPGCRPCSWRNGERSSRPL